MFNLRIPGKVGQRFHAPSDSAEDWARHYANDRERLPALTALQLLLQRRAIGRHPKIGVTVGVRQTEVFRGGVNEQSLILRPESRHGSWFHVVGFIEMI